MREGTKDEPRLPGSGYLPQAMSAFTLDLVPERTTPVLVPHIERILDAAHLAPSRDNLQPWRFVVDSETVSFFVDHERDRSPANAEGRMARMAVGAAIE